MIASASLEQTSIDKPGPAYRRINRDQLVQMLILHSRGLSQAEIAKTLGCSQPTVSDHIGRFSTDTREVAAKLLSAEALDNVLLWKKAAKVAASKGDSRPAQALAEAAMPELRGQQQGSGVQVNIGLVNSEAALPAIQIAPLSPSSQLPESES